MKIALISLGCNKNLVDSEMILGEVIKHGYSITDNEEDADIVIINTCAFINDAKKESIESIINTGELKNNNLKALIVTGCLAKRYEEEIRNSIPEVDLIAGINDYETIIEFIDKIANREHEKVSEVSYKNRIRSTPPHTAYVKIADGCDNHCTYCVIPGIRGKYISRTIEDIYDEVVALSNEGVKEIVLVAQDTTYYGLDIYGERSLAKLLNKLEEILDIHWIRFLYAYPEGVTDELIDVVANSKKICHYFDIPIQHINDEVLKRMGRKTCREKIEGLISKLREKIPDVILRTSLIVGFPGETKKQFNELCEFVKNIGFDKLGVFEYSKEEGTPSAKLKGQVTKFVKKYRKDKIMKIQQKVSVDKNRQAVDKVYEVLVEGKLPEGVFVGRTYKDSPEIDGNAFIKTELELPLGEFVEAKLVQALEYDGIFEVEE